MKEVLLKKASVAICTSAKFYLHGKSCQNAEFFFPEVHVATHTVAYVEFCSYSQNMKNNIINLQVFVILLRAGSSNV